MPEISDERLYIDTEFNGFNGELISMALVAEDGREWYAVLPEPRIWDPWVYEHVLPKLSTLKPTIYAVSREELRVSLKTWLEQFSNLEQLRDRLVVRREAFEVIGDEATGRILSDVIGLIYEAAEPLRRARTVLASEPATPNGSGTP